MARIPGEPQSLPIPRGRAAPVVGIRDPVGPTMSRVGGAIAGAANELQVAFDREQARVDQGIVEDAFNKLRQRQIELSVGEDGFSQHKSGDAVTKPLLKDYDGRFRQAYDELEGKLTNDRQRNEFRQRYEFARSQYTKDILQHVNRENGVYRKQTMDATVDTEKNFAAIHWNIKGDVYASRERAKAAIKAFAEANDLDAQATEVLYRDATTQIHQAVIERAINENRSQYAAQWLKDHRKEIDSDVAKSLQASLKTAGTREAAQSAFDRIRASHPGDFNAQKAAARKLDSEIRDNVISRIRAEDSDRQRQKQILQTDAFQAGLGHLADKAAQNVTPTLDDIPHTVWETMNGQQQSAILREIDGYITGKKVEKAGPVYYELQQFHANSEEEFATLDLNEFRGQITPAEMDEFIGYQKDFATKGPTGDIARTKSEIIKQGMVEAKMDPKDLLKDNSNGEQAREYHRRIDAELEALGRDITPQDVRDVVDRLNVDIIKGRRRRFLWDVDIPAGLAEIEGIPTDEIDELAEAIDDAGQPVTIENIRKYYRHRQGLPPEEPEQTKQRGTRRGTR